MVILNRRGTTVLNVFARQGTRRKNEAGTCLENPPVAAFFSKKSLRVEEIVVIYQLADRIQPPFSRGDGLFRPEGHLSRFALSVLSEHCQVING
jgi:hypothetical protein